jgi:sigma-B regulation protein RsbU (phosphoserine phosphatase)
MSVTENLKVKRNLTALVEFSRVINSSLDMGFILNNVLLTCLGKFLATKGLIGININGKIVLKSSKGIAKDSLQLFPDLDADDECTSKTLLIQFMENTSLVVVEKISSSKECVGIVCLGEKLNKQSYSSDDLEFLKTILNISASAIQNSLVIEELKKVNRDLDSRIQKLNSLFELSKEFGLFSESTKVAKLLIYSIIGQFLVSKFAVVTFDGKQPKILESKFPKEDVMEFLGQFDFYNLQNPLGKDELKKIIGDDSALQVNLIVPMQIHGKTKGLIILGKRINELPYSNSDIEFIYSVGGLAIISLENQRLFKEALEKLKLEEELELAREIQQKLLPQSIPGFKNFDIAAFNIPSKQVGGDYYDIISIDEKKFYVAIADVSGKGVPASLLMASMQAFLKIICRQKMRIDDATAMINDLITENTSEGRFITFFWAEFDDENKTINYVNAGHNPPLLIRKNKIIKLEKGGIILGVMNTMIPYASEQLTLLKDDVLVLFTDGISEAMNSEGEEFSDEKLESLSKKSAGMNASQILDKIKTEVQNFAKGTSQSDDITLIVVKVK